MDFFDYSSLDEVQHQGGTDNSIMIRELNKIQKIENFRSMTNRCPLPCNHDFLMAAIKTGEAAVAIKEFGAFVPEPGDRKVFIH
ncbi:hypothetical protein JTE90_019575 [Oedothorax gibbosus]|uniref:Uncharacterized protein n=1 Tax=Oedothorax gibbosus TaxID=931172 RepID=A0AAV6V5E1_9ARAC|nr:hypothetical protein JTE90_019575 [Oedothorax gibbosus]